MTEEMIKEHLSRCYLELVGNRRGYICLNPSVDLGVDLTFAGHIRRREGGGFRYMKSDKHIDVQLKCTCETSVTRANGLIKFDLKRKNYNDLVHRRGGHTPLVLVVVVLPDNVDDWLTVSASELVFRRCGYWYFPEPAALPTTSATKRISIPDQNVLTLDFFAERFTDHYGTAA